MRTCSNCNFMMPDAFNGRRCRRCKIVLPTRLCPHCKRLRSSTEFYDDDSHGVCKDCYKTINYINYHKNTAAKRLAIRAKYKQDTDAALVAWLADIKRPTKMLNEDQWHRACSYFNGCAFCSDENIEVRWIFVPQQLFGKGSYTACNVIPVCGKCGEVLLKGDFNPFSYMGYAGIFKDKIDNVVDYLQIVLEDINNG